MLCSLRPWTQDLHWATPRKHPPGVTLRQPNLQFKLVRRISGFSAKPISPINSRQLMMKFYFGSRFQNATVWLVHLQKGEQILQIIHE